MMGCLVIVSSGYRYVGEKNTNNEAEYAGLILGIEAAVKLGLGNVVIKGDSQLVIQQVRILIQLLYVKATIVRYYSARMTYIS